jgi:nucleotide-binding universal stress UspA family protein
MRMSDGRVVAGVDGSTEHVAPVAWAYHEAGRRGAALDLVHAWSLPLEISPLGVPGDGFDPATFEAGAKQRLDHVVAAVSATLRDDVASVNLLTPCGGASRALLEASEDADLLVVGQRGRGALLGLLGSVSHQCVHHVRCPIAVVPTDWPSGATPERVVVGVDGSSGSAAALRWAMDEAALWGTPLTVVHSWYTPYPVEPWGVVVTPDDRELFIGDALAMIDEMVTTAEHGGARRPAKVVPMTIEEAAGPALVHASDAADLLVVGSRGRGGFSALLLGSTSLHCVHHAECPVIVVPPSRS